jgi:ribosome-binding factor A
MSRRTEQIESLLHRAVSEVLSRGLSDPRLDTPGIMISVTKVDVSPDLHAAKVLVTVMPAKYERRAMAALDHATGYVQAQVRRRVRLRTVPRLSFEPDESLKKQTQVLADIQTAMRRTPAEAEDQEVSKSADQENEQMTNGPSEKTREGL